MAGREREFDGTLFLVWAKTIFLLFLDARHRNTLESMKPHFSPRLFAAWKNFRAHRVERRRSIRAVNFEVQAAELTNHYQANDYEVAVVNFTGLAAQADNRRKIPPRLIKESWTFLRPVSPEGQICPKDGPPWKLNAFGKCPYCGREFTGTKDGWLVGNVVNLNPPASDPFQDENAFLDYQDDILRRIQSSRGNL